jgi:sulfur relay (sulfurtransferase) DsrC/TusE family protein
MAKDDVGYTETANKLSEEKDEVMPKGEEGMTRAKWLALIALGIRYTTTFQQGTCIRAIIKSIDEALGMINTHRSKKWQLTLFEGSTSYYNWMLSASTITSTISLPFGQKSSCA